MQNGKKSGNPLYIYENSGIIKEYPSSEGGRIFMYDKTMTFSVNDEKEIEMKKTLMLVYDALTKKGYNPVNQIVGYIMSGDPTYVTSFNGARSLIMKVERDELVEEMLKAYIRNNNWE